LRYLVHRHFLHKYHLSIIGMEGLHVSSSSPSEAKLIAELTPNYVRSVLNESSEESGFSLEDTAALVAVIDRLVHDAGHEQLEAAYNAAGFDVTDLLTRDQLFKVIQHYALRWFHGFDQRGPARIEANRTLFDSTMREWKEYLQLAKGHIMALDYQRSHGSASASAHGLGLKEAWSPLRPLFSFADSLGVVSNFATQFGSFWETECEDLMQLLVKSDRRGTGRVTLASFHAQALAGEWHFTESAEYLRLLGVLDESSAFRGPQVIASNYIQGANNCVVGQQHFRVCCANPCQDYYTDLEEAIGAPEGAPEDVLAIVSNFTYGLEDTAPQLTRKLRAQLMEIAQANHGKIPLHGRLFAQWLHFVLPTECPFPHKSDTVSGLSPKEHTLTRALASAQEMKENVKRGKELAKQEDVAAEDDSDMWSYEEELLSHRLHERRRDATTSWRATFRPVLFCLATLSVFVIAIVQPALKVISEAGEFGFWAGKERSASGASTKAHLV